MARLTLGTLLLVLLAGLLPAAAKTSAQAAKALSAGPSAAPATPKGDLAADMPPAETSAPEAGLSAEGAAEPVASDAGQAPASAPRQAAPGAPGARFTRDLQLDVSVNGAPTGLVAAFHETAGVLLIEPDELRSVGILPRDEARQADGRIRIDRLPGVTYGYDEGAQTIDFTASDAERAARIIDTEGSRSILDAGADPPPTLQSGFGALLNYSLFATTRDGTPKQAMHFGGLSGSFEGRIFSPFGVLAQTFVAKTDPEGAADATRLETSWAFSDPATLHTYRIGDLITAGLDWTRPTRLAGLQLQKNFALRADLVTLPIPEISGSAAVPSTVDVYLNGARRFSRDVAAGPFELTNLPVVTGAGTARVVVRDSSGQEKVSESSFFASSKLLAAGLVDYSAEVGFGRQGFGRESDAYDMRPMASGSLRYGVTDWLTAEAHAEGGADIVNGGLGAAMAVGSIGTVSGSVAGSRTESATGLQLGASAEIEIGDIALSGRVQRSFGDYQDIASIIDAASQSEDGLFPLSRRPPKAINQVAVSLPLVFDPSSLNLSFTQIQSFDDETKSVVGFSYSRQVMKTATAYVAGFKDLESDAFGFHAGLTIPLGKDYSASSSASLADRDGVAGASFSKRGGQDVGDYSWQIRDTEGETPRRSAYGAYRASFGEFGAGLGQSGDRFRASAEVDGAVVAAGGDVFLSTPIDDAFAVVDVGVPGVEVQHENRAVGRTNAKGKLLLPKLRAFEKNRISIDPADLRLDTSLNTTRQIVVPADRSGVVVAFDAGETGSSALVTFRDAAGAPLELGLAGRVGADGAPFLIGYDGQAYVEGLSATNHIVVDLPDGSQCAADVAYASGGGAQVSIPDAVCRAGS